MCSGSDVLVQYFGPFEVYFFHSLSSSVSIRLCPDSQREGFEDIRTSALGGSATTQGTILRLSYYTEFLRCVAEWSWMHFLHFLSYISVDGGSCMDGSALASESICPVSGLKAQQAPLVSAWRDVSLYLWHLPVCPNVAAAVLVLCHRLSSPGRSFLVMHYDDCLQSLNLQPLSTIYIVHSLLSAAWLCHVSWGLAFYIAT